MPHYNFKDDFAVARKTESQIANFLQEIYGYSIVSWCNTKDYDFIAVNNLNEDVYYEVKEDFTCKRTGNVGVEYSSWGRESGIVTTKADKYIWKVHAPDTTIRVYEMTVRELREHIANKKYFREVVGGDVGSESKNYLFKLEFFEKNATFLGYLER